MSSSLPPAPPRFWRDAALPFIEARGVDDGRQACYAPHSHEHFSIGAVTAGHSTYLHQGTEVALCAGAVVLMNPEDVHACNPIDDQLWSYRMLYIDTPWLADLQHQLGFTTDQGFRSFQVAYTNDPVLYAGLNELYELLVNEHAEHLLKHSAVVSFFTQVQQRLNPASATRSVRDSNHKLQRAAEYIHAHCTQPVQLEDICLAAELSPSYLIRAFKQHYGMTPHAFLVNRRIQFARAQLRQGKLIADVALDAGFADQAHFQRAFKQHLSVTPGQYRA